VSEGTRHTSSTSAATHELEHEDTAISSLLHYHRMITHRHSTWTRGRRFGAQSSRRGIGDGFFL